MSASKKGRFGGLSVKFPTTPEAAQDTAATSPDGVQESRELLGAQIRSDLKSAIKQASAIEKRKIYQLTEDAIEEYLNRNHPSLLKNKK